MSKKNNSLSINKVFLQKVTNYNPFNKNEKSMLMKIIGFLRKNNNVFDNNYQAGHITGSAWILSSDRSQVLLTHHVKLGIWIQLGGHADSNPNIYDVAKREAKEESGLELIEPLSKSIFDVDVHEIPARKDFPAHKHYDIRFLFTANEKKRLTVSDESHNLAWINLTEVQEYNNETSILRMVKKSENSSLSEFIQNNKWCPSVIS